MTCTVTTWASGALCLVGLALGLPAFASDGHAPHWGYDGQAGPAAWGHLAKDYEACAVGKQQSPVDLSGGDGGAAPTLAVHYAAQPLVAANNGHTIQVTMQPGNYIDLGGERYDLLQYHFHFPSEHMINGKTAAMEVHLVHRNAKGALAVVGVMIQSGQANRAIAEVWSAVDAHGQPGPALDPAALLPRDLASYRYEGSLTTPPCSEIVHWIVLKAPIEASDAQIHHFAALFPMNARPVQPLNNRPVIDGN